MRETVIRLPFTVYRPSHRMTNNVLTHGSRLHGARSAAIWTPPTANSQQPEAILRLTKQSSKRKPFQAFSSPFKPFQAFSNILTNS